MGQFEDETAISAHGDGRWSCRLDPAWNIGDNANGGYALAPVVRAMREMAGKPDPISVTAHFLRPSTGGVDAELDAEVIRSGRTISTMRGSLSQRGTTRVVVLAAFGDLSVPVLAVESDSRLELGPEPPSLPPPEDCVRREDLAQGVPVSLTSRVDIRLNPDEVREGYGRARISGWVRFADGADPTVMALPFFADTFPPPLVGLVGPIGWVPTLELTVHVRRRPCPGWIMGAFECDDAHDGRMIETGTLWDESGRVVARCRQIGLLTSARPTPAR